MLTWVTMLQVRLLKFHSLLSSHTSSGSSSKSNSSRVGPKSDRTCRNPLRTRVATTLLHVLLWSRFNPGEAVGVDVRVDVDPTRTSGASSAKLVGFGEARSPIHNQDISSCAKRTYRRAYARACREGGSYYKGQWREHHWFRPVSIRTRALPGRHRPATRQQSLRTLTWNAGGLRSQVFRELETYAIDSALDVCMVQETKWTFDGNWSTRHFHYIHSAGEAKEDRVGGILIMVSTKVVPKSADIQFHAVHPGRLLHVRINRKQPIDVLNLYQYAANDNKLTPDRRHKFLLRFRHTPAVISTPPVLHLKRSAENGSCQQRRLITKTLVISWPFFPFTPARCPTGQLASQIDYLVCRQGQATHSAKQAAVLQQFPVAVWRDGAKHHPLFAQITIPEHQWPKAEQPKIPKLDTAQLIADLRQPAPSPALQAWDTAGPVA